MCISCISGSHAHLEEQLLCARGPALAAQADDGEEKPCSTHDEQAALPHKQETDTAINFVGEQKNSDKPFVGKSCQRGIFFKKKSIPAFVHICFLSDLY